MTIEWREVRLGDLVDQRAILISDGYRVRNEELGLEGIPFVRGGDIGDGWINTETRDHIRPELARRVEAKLAQPGDVAFITKGTVGRAGRLRPGQPPVVFAPQVAYWRVTDTSVLDPTFVFFLVRSYEFQSALDAVKTHGAMVADYVSIAQQHDFRLRLPGIEAQRAIGQILGALDDKIELNRRASVRLEDTAQALFKSWFADFNFLPAKAKDQELDVATSATVLPADRASYPGMGPIPSGWSIMRLGEAVEVLRDSVDPSSSPTTLFLHFSIPAYDDGQTPVLENGANIKSQKFRVPSDVILLSKLNPEIDRVWMVDIASSDRAICSTEFLVLRPCGQVGREYVYCLLRSASFRRKLEALVTGTSKSHQRARPEAILKLPVVRPSKGAIDAFAGIAAPLLRRVLLCRAESRTLGALRDTLLPKLLSGELRLKDAELLVGTAT